VSGLVGLQSIKRTFKQLHTNSDRSLVGVVAFLNSPPEVFIYFNDVSFMLQSTHFLYLRLLKALS
jgi:hypothetical protein